MFTYCIWKAGMRHTLLPVLLTPPHNVFRHVVKAMQMQPIIETLHKAVFKTTFACRFNRITYFLLHLENSYEIYFATVAADTIMHRFRHAVKLYKGNQSLNRRTKSSSKQYFLIGSV